MCILTAGNLRYALIASNSMMAPGEKDILPFILVRGVRDVAPSAKPGALSRKVLASPKKDFKSVAVFC
jgi:hypothetical protein